MKATGQRLFPIIGLLLAAACNLGDGADGPAAPQAPGSADPAGERPGALTELGGPCNIDEDCTDDLICVDSCEDWCDQTVWPNLCCTRGCGHSSRPWACEPSGGVAVLEGEDCPATYVAPAQPEDWATSPAVFDCCLPAQECETIANRVRCEALPYCAWALSGQVGIAPNDGACESL